MKKKQSRSPDAETAPEGVAPTETEDTPAAKKRSSLPAFGFASDLLKKKGDPTADEATASSEAPPVPAAEVDPAAPTRIFDFVDRLEDDGDEEERRPVRLGTFVTFELAGEVFGIPVDPVRQVVRVSGITRVPHAPRPIRGVTNLRGRVIPVIDLRLRIGLEETALGRSTRVMAVSSRGRVLGLLVDAVQQVVHLDLDEVQPPPDDVMTLQSDYIRGVYDREDGLILLLDIDRALIIREAGAA